MPLARRSLGTWRASLLAFVAVIGIAGPCRAQDTPDSAAPAQTSPAAKPADSSPAPAPSTGPPALLPQIPNPDAPAGTPVPQPNTAPKTPTDSAQGSGQPEDVEAPSLQNH
jgi:hypothetical protein